MSKHLYQASLRAMLQKSVWSGVRHTAMDGALLDTNIRLLLAQIAHLHDRIPNRDLSGDDLLCAVEAGHQGQLREDLAAYVREVGATQPAAESTVREVLARELLDQTATKILDNRNLGILDVAGPATLIDKAREVADGSASTPTLTLEDFDLPSVGSERGEVLSTGVSDQLDRVLDGGIGLGEMITYLGKSGIGKTSIMVSTGRGILKQGRNVLHVIVGDSSAPKIARLYERSAIHVRKSDWTDSHTLQARECLRATGGQLWIKDLSGHDTTVDSLEAVIRSVQRSAGVPIHCVIVDYLELMSPGRGRDGGAQRYLYGQLCNKVRSLGPKLGTRIVTAWQVNREGAQKDTATEYDLSELWDIFKHTDMLVVLNRSEPEKRNNRMRLVVRKTRSDGGDDGQVVNVFCDWKEMRIEDPVEVKSAVHRPGGAEDSVRVQTGGIGERGAETSGVARRPQLPADGTGDPVHLEERT